MNGVETLIPEMELAPSRLRCEGFQGFCYRVGELGGEFLPPSCVMKNGKLRHRRSRGMLYDVKTKR